MKSSQNKFIGLEKDGLTYISDSISTLGEQPFRFCVILRLRVLSGHLSAFQTPCSADRRQRASFLYSETPCSFNL